MEQDERRKINLQQHTLSPVSKKYLFRIIFYAVVLTGLSVFILYLYNRETEKKPTDNSENTEEIRNIQLNN